MYCGEFGSYFIGGLVSSYCSSVYLVFVVRSKDRDNKRVV